MNTCCGGKPARLCLRWSRCGAASDSRAVQAFHFPSGGVSPATASRNDDAKNIKNVDVESELHRS
jgi:hypothetical protein